jgi:DNA-directed RNA polymerase specialized sigma24 family protein/ribosome-associated translation inhibitor RaiA
MNVHVSYRLHKTPALEKDIQRHIEKLRRRLQVFRPELVHLKGALEENSAREGATVSLNLRLPSGQMAVEVSAARARTAANRAFEDLLHQLGKHKDLLRASHKWRRRQNDAPRRRISETPFEQTLAVTYPPQVSADDVRGYVNFNLARLQRFVEREIYFRELQDLLAPETLTAEEVIDETIVAALGDGDEKPERLALEPWLYKLALRALGELSHREESDEGAVHLEDSARPRNVKASDEAELQFHQPDETFTGESIIPDDRVATPEDIFASDEILRLIAAALRDLGAETREAFILYALEGFAIDEIVAITRLPAERVLISISVARDCLRKAPGLASEFRGRLGATGAA